MLNHTQAPTTQYSSTVALSKANDNARCKGAQAICSHIAELIARESCLFIDRADWIRGRDAAAVDRKLTANTPDPTAHVTLADAAPQ